MSDSFSPTFKNTDGVSQQFGGEQTLTWNFTSATGNPMELVVGGSTYFTFDRNGAMQLESDITWNSDSGGDVGAQYTTRPAKVHAATSVAVGAVSGTGDGSSLTLNRLTLGHGDVDKYVDAEQGLVSTPFIRYNAVNARWEYSDDGITDYPFGLVFGVLDWDSLYAADKSLNINSSTLTWTQTSTTDSAFDILRNLASANTDSPIVIIEQQNAGDDQPGLALGQVAPATSALDIYEGTVSGGDKRFTFVAEGQLGIVTSSVLAAAALSVEQADTDEAFLLATGTAAADASTNVSTANNPTADMIRVEVDGGGGAATRWMPAYASHVLPGAPTWDSIYAGDKDLDINGAVLQFEQTNTSDYAFEIFRNLDLTSTDSPIVYIHNSNSGDDQAALYVTGGIGNVTGGVDVIQVASTSAGMTAGTEQLRGVDSTVTANAGDAAGSSIVSFYADATAAGSSTLYGLFASSSFDYGFWSESTGAFNIGGTTEFVYFNGNPQAGAAGNISTDEVGTADMLRVNVEGNARWIPAYVATTIAHPSWDDIYAGDKLLDIDAAVLQFQQTATSGYGFEVFRNLAAASTDSPVMRVYNSSTLDDQAALSVTNGIGAITGGVPALAVESTSAGMTGGTESLYGVSSIVNAHATDAAGSWLASYYADAVAAGSSSTYGIYCTANFDYGLYSLSTTMYNIGGTTDFVYFDGNPQAGAAGNISTDEAGTADMLRVNVEGNTRWVPAYNTTTLAGISSWDGIYAADPNSNVLTVSSNDEPLAIDQTSSSGAGFKVGRTTAISSAVETDSLIYVDNSLTGGDSGALYVTHGSGDTGAETYAVTINLVDTLYNPGLLIAQATTAETDSDKYMFHITDEGSDRYYIRRDGTSYQETSGLGANDPVATFQQNDLENGIDVLGRPSSNSSYGVYVNEDWALSFYGATPVYVTSNLADPTLELHQYKSGYPALYASYHNSTTHNIAEFYDDSTIRNTIGRQGQITISSGALASTTASTTSIISVSGGSFNLDGGAGDTLTGVRVDLTEGNLSANSLPVYGAYFTYDSSASGSEVPRAIEVTNEWNYGLYSASPGYVASAGSTSALQVERTGSTGDILQITDNSTDRYNIDYECGILHDPRDQDDSFSAYDLTLTSSGIGDSSTVIGLDINLEGNAGDIAVGTSYYGAQFNFTANTTTVPTIVALDIDGNWDYGLYSASPGYIESSSSTVSALVVNQTTTPNILDLQESTTSRFTVDNTGATAIVGSNTIPDFGLSITLNSAGNNDTVPFIRYVGTSKLDNSRNISTAPASSFTHAGAVKVDIDGSATEYWMIYYTYGT